MFSRFKIDKATGLPKTPNGETWEVSSAYGEYCHLSLRDSSGYRVSAVRMVGAFGAYLTPDKLSKRLISSHARKMLAERYPSKFKQYLERREAESRLRYQQKRESKTEKFVGHYPPKKL